MSIPAQPWDRISIYVRAAWMTEEGGSLGPASDLSEPVVVFPSPVFGATANWSLLCSECGRFEIRSVGDPSQVTVHQARSSPWVMETRIDSPSNGSRFVWYNWDTDQLLLTSTEDPSLPPIGPFPAPETSIVLDIDLLGDGDEEILFYDHRNGNRIELWDLSGDVPTFLGAPPTPSSGTLGPIADYDGDGEEDLLWIRSGQPMEVWSLKPFAQYTGTWEFEHVYDLDKLGHDDYPIVGADDFDGDGWQDLLWRGTDGSLWITYLAGDGDSIRTIELPGEPDDIHLEFVGSAEINSNPGAEIALRDRRNGRLWIMYPRSETTLARSVHFDTGSDWRVVDFGF